MTDVEKQHISMRKQINEQRSDERWNDYRERKYNRLKSGRNAKIHQGFSISGNILVVVLALLVFFNIFNAVVLQSNLVFTFSSFLEFVKDAPSIDISWVTSTSSWRIPSDADWGTFNFLKSFFNGFMDCFTAILYMANGLAQGCVYVGYVFDYFMGT